MVASMVIGGLFYYAQGLKQGYVQSLILVCTLIIIDILTDVFVVNRKIQQETQYQLGRMAYEGKW